MQTNHQLRTALMHIQNLADALDLDEPNVIAILDTCRDALAEPVRNCEVGTAEEQAERFVEFCDEEKGNREHCRNCRLCNAKDCTLAWTQMPYEEGGTK